MNIERLRQQVDIGAVVVGIADAVGRRPMLAYLMDELESQELHDSRGGFERWPISRRKFVFDGLSAPTLGLMGVRNRSASGGSMYLATATSKVASGPAYSRVNLEQLSALAPDTWEVVKETCPSVVNRVRGRRTGESEIHLLTKAESQQLVKKLAEEPDNHEALYVAYWMLLFHHVRDDNAWAQYDAIDTARKALGFGRDNTLIEIFLGFEEEDFSKFTTLTDLDPDWLREDRVIMIDSMRIPGFVNISCPESYRACAEFRKGDEELTIYTANRTRLEEAVGVDLVIINEVLGNVVMVQYKMLEMVGGGGKTNWIYRPDPQLDAELKRMEIWDPPEKVDDYRMLRDPFYFKFVTRQTIRKKPGAFYMTKDHFNMVRRDPKMWGSGDGVRIDARKLRSAYLQNEVMLGLIRSGYVGTHGVEKDEIVEYIDGMASNQKAYVIAWKRRFR